MGADQTVRWRTGKQCLEGGNHLLLDYALCPQHHGLIAFDFNDEFIVDLEHELRLAGQRCAEPRVDTDQCLNGNFRRGTLNR